MKTRPYGAVLVTLARRRFKKRPRGFLLLLALAGGYLGAPGIAGLLGFGDRSGPVVYPESFHANLYSLAYEGVRNETPRQSYDNWMYDRPIFYGLPRRLKPSDERVADIEWVRQNRSPVLENMVRMNQEVESRPGDRQSYP